MRLQKPFLPQREKNHFQIKRVCNIVTIAIIECVAMNNDIGFDFAAT